MISQDLIKLAQNTKFYGLKKLFTHMSKYKNRKCGDTISLQLITKKNKILSMRYETNSCIFCQASASLLANSINAFKKNDVSTDIKIINNFFKNNENKLPKRLNIFRKILKKENLSRLDCIMLPFNALHKALKD